MVMHFSLAVRSICPYIRSHIQVTPLRGMRSDHKPNIRLGRAAVVRQLGPVPICGRLGPQGHLPLHANALAQGQLRHPPHQEAGHTGLAGSPWGPPLHPSQEDQARAGAQQLETRSVDLSHADLRGDDAPRKYQHGGWEQFLSRDRRGISRCDSG